MKIKRSTRYSTATPLIERAYQLAHSGAFAGWSEISDRLKREGYTATFVNVHLEGKAIRADLKRICDEAKRGSLAAAPVLWHHRLCRCLAAIAIRSQT